MSKWQYKVSFKDFYQNDDMTVEKKAHMVAKRLDSVRRIMLRSRVEYVRELAGEIEVVVDGFKEFEGVTKPNDLLPGYVDSSDVQEFDNLMYDLYNIADTPLDDQFGGKKLLWVATI